MTRARTSIEWLRHTFVAVCWVSGLGCSVILPAHPRSLDRDGEDVTVRMLGCADLAADAALRDAYRATFQVSTETVCARALTSETEYVLRRGSDVLYAGPSLNAALERVSSFSASALPAIAVQAGAWAAGAAVDFVARELAEEADRYTAQYEGRVFFDRFWTRELSPEEPATLTAVQARALAESGAELSVRRASMRQTYLGFELRRSTRAHTPSFRLVMGIAPSADQQVFSLAPLVAERASSKAKVLADRGWTYLPIPYGWLLDAGDEVATHVDLEVVATWRTAKDKAGEQSIRTDKLASLSFDLPDQRLPRGIATDGAAASGASAGALASPGSRGGWFGAIPTSFDFRGRDVGLGTGSIRVLITERDPSNAKKDLEKAAEAVAKQKDRVTGKVRGLGESG
ncbi:MAG: hypothetical protein IPK07_16015 [Deltaproteobacteria bacterium]|nr:hypothetical protein [Deltaproteobacteria bacterium]